MKYLIINLTRLGDIIQSLAMIRGLKEKDTHCQIDFLAMSSFGDILRNISEINEVVLLDDKKLIENVKEDFWEGFNEIYAKVAYLNSKNYDELINPVISQQSSYLSYLIKAKTKRGMLITANREQSIKSKWSSFLLANQHNLGDHAFNLVDIFSGVANIKNKLEYYYLKSPENVQNQIDLLFNKEITNNRQIIGFHIGASQSNKSWNVDYFKQVITALLKTHNYEVILFGGYKELDVKVNFEDITDRAFHNWIGFFQLDQLVCAIGKVNLFVTNDTGPMHIAACNKVPIINISLGPVSMWETGPYSENAIIIQANLACHPCNFTHNCTHWNCHKNISPEIVFNTILYHFTQNEAYLPNNEVLYWKSVKDPFSLIHWVPVKKREITQKELFFEFKRAIWGNTLFGYQKTKNDCLRPYFAFLELYFKIPIYDFSIIRDNITNQAYIINKIQKYLVEISKTSLNNKINLDKIKIIWQNVKDLKEQLFKSAKEDSVIYDWFLNLSFQESQLESEDIKMLTLQTADLYQILSLQLESMVYCLNYFYNRSKDES